MIVRALLGLGGALLLAWLALIATLLVARPNGDLLKQALQLIALTDGAAEILAVKVPGLPGPGIRQGHPVKVSGLVAQPWTMQDRSGVAFRAARIESAVPQAKAS